MSKVVRIGNVSIGGKNQVAVQSMTNTQTADAVKTIEQIARLADVGCDIVRVAVKSAADAEAIAQIKKKISLPLVADIHFDYRLGLAAIVSGADKIRINPCNIPVEKLELIAAAAKERDIPIRIGVNSGSIEKDLLARLGFSAEAIVESAKRSIERFEKLGNKIVVSVKSSSVTDTIKSYRLLSAACDYPLHLGVTEAGVGTSGIIKSAVGIGSLLADGIGDTIRVSLSGDPTQEIAPAKKIIEAAGRAVNYIEVVSCPTCGRTEIAVEQLALAVEAAVRNIKPSRRIKIAVMGCVVNGPGEAADADIAVMGGGEKSVLYLNGKPLKTIPNSEILPQLLALIKNGTN